MHAFVRGSRPAPFSKTGVRKLNSAYFVAVVPKSLFALASRRWSDMGENCQHCARPPQEGRVYISTNRGQRMVPVSGRQTCQLPVEFIQDRRGNRGGAAEHLPELAVFFANDPRRQTENDGWWGLNPCDQVFLLDDRGSLVVGEPHGGESYRFVCWAAAGESGSSFMRILREEGAVWQESDEGEAVRFQGHWKGFNPLTGVYTPRC